MNARILLLGLGALAQAQDDDVEQPYRTVGGPDPAPYARALVDRFGACASAEGIDLSGADAEAIADALDAVSGAMRIPGVSACMIDEGTVASCASVVSGMSCEALQAGIEAVISGDLGMNVPDWAGAYAQALGERVSACFTAETGRSLTDAEKADLTLFRNALGGSIGQLGQSCTVRAENVGVCVSGAAALSCANIADWVGAEDGMIDAASLVGNCPGLLDCGGDDN